MVRVLFVCLGNICRSTMAEAVFRKLVEEEGLANQIMVDSAGTAGWHAGEPPHQGTQEILEKHQISHHGITSRQIHTRDWHLFHYIIAMDEQNIADLQLKKENDDVVLAKLTDFIEDDDVTYVPDPYYTGDFNYTYELVTLGCRNLLKEIKTNLI